VLRFYSVDGLNDDALSGVASVLLSDLMVQVLCRSQKITLQLTRISAATER
jgi:hypothetical protein